MRLLITGSRDWDDPKRIKEIILTLRSVTDNLTIVHGGCPTGADKIAEMVADRYMISQDVFPADWSLGRAGGPIRNHQMVDSKPDVCYAFIKNNSRGASHCAKAAIKAGITTLIFRDIGPVEIHKEGIK